MLKFKECILSLFHSAIEGTGAPVTRQEAMEEGMTTHKVIRVNCGTLWGLLEQSGLFHTF